MELLTVLFVQNSYEFLQAKEWEDAQQAAVLLFAKFPEPRNPVLMHTACQENTTSRRFMRSFMFSSVLGLFGATYHALILL